MTNFISKTYILKREIVNFANKISPHLSRPEKKFTADITYGMLASGSYLLTDFADRLHDPLKRSTLLTVYLDALKKELLRL